MTEYENVIYPADHLEIGGHGKVSFGRSQTTIVKSPTHKRSKTEH